MVVLKLSNFVYPGQVIVCSFNEIVDRLPSCRFLSSQAIENEEQTNGTFTNICFLNLLVVCINSFSKYFLGNIALPLCSVSVLEVFKGCRIIFIDIFQ